MKIKTYKLSEISRISAGGDRPRNFSKTKTETLNIPVYSNGKEKNDLIGFTDYAKITTPSITISARGTVGYVSLRLEPYVPIIRLISVEPDISKVDLLYLYYLLNNKKVTGEGSIQKQLTVPMISNLEITIHELSMQKHISKILYDLDSKIILNNKINLELEELANTIYNYWFVQFDFPDENGKPYKSSGGQMVWNEELKKEIPKDWEVKKLSDFLNVVTGKKDANFATENGPYNFFTCGEDILRCNEYEFEGKALLVAGNGNFNIKHYNGKFNAYQRTYVLIPYDEKFYSLLFLSVKEEIAKLTRGSRGSIIKFITKGDLENIRIAIPKDTVLDLFGLLNTLTAKIEMNIEENNELSKLRDFLLPLLMNGQVTIND